MDLDKASLHETSLNEAITRGTSANAAPVNGTSANAAPVNGTSARGTSANAAPARGTSTNGTAVNGTSTNEAKEEIVNQATGLVAARELLLTKVQNLLGLARRAQHLQLGLTAVCKAISYNQADLVFLASDLALDSKRKVLNLLLSKTSKKRACYCCSLFTREELSLKLDSERAILALPKDGFSEAIKASLIVYKEQLQAELLEKEIEPSEYFNKLQTVCQMYAGTKRREK